MTNDKEIEKVTLRISVELYERVKELAKKERRSINFVLTELVEYGVSQAEPPLKPSSLPTSKE